jgi:hypothetical protein
MRVRACELHLFDQVLPAEWYAGRSGQVVRLEATDRGVSVHLDSGIELVMFPNETLEVERVELPPVRVSL